MEASSSGSLVYDQEARVLERLLDIFGSTVSLKEIASVFCKAGRDADLAAEILSGSQGCSSSVAAASDASNSELVAVSSSELPSENAWEDVVRPNRNGKASKQRRNPVSVGTVSNVLGKGYSRPPTTSTGSFKTTKPMKISFKDLPTDEVEGKEVLDSTTRKHPIHNDVEEFIFKMLGDGYQLGMDVIRDVLGSCGYDANKSIEKLIDLSASTLKKSDDIVGGISEKYADEDPTLGHLVGKAESQGGDIALRNEREAVNRHRYDLQKEVLTSLFNVPERIEEVPKRSLVRAVKKTRSFGKVVSGPPDDTTTEILPITRGEVEEMDYDAEGDDSYHILRRQAKEYWNTMKEYYKEAMSAHANGNHAVAEELIQQGQFFNGKAREADEKSAQLILEWGNEEKQEKEEKLVLDLHDQDIKSARRLLKWHLTSLADIPDIQHLKVIVETDGQDTTDGARIKRMVVKILERESVRWMEEENGKTISIPLYEINPQKLSFYSSNEEVVL